MPDKDAPAVEKYRAAVKSNLDSEDGLQLVLGVFNRLLQKDEAGTLEGDEVMRFAVLKEVALEHQQ